MVQALVADGADDAFETSSLPRGTWRRKHLFDPFGLDFAHLPFSGHLDPASEHHSMLADPIGAITLGFVLAPRANIFSTSAKMAA